VSFELPQWDRKQLGVNVASLTTLSGPIAFKAVRNVLLLTQGLGRIDYPQASCRIRK
jgi:hypothetical protein